MGIQKILWKSLLFYVFENVCRIYKTSIDMEFFSKIA